MADESILVVEDDPITLRFLVSLLTERGYRVVEAADGDTGFDLARRHPPDLVITDLVMPYRDGYGLVRAIRDHERLRDVPVLILSMRDREDDIVRGFDDGADDYVVKPFNARELLARVRKLLSRASAVAQ